MQKASRPSEVMISYASRVEVDSTEEEVLRMLVKSEVVRDETVELGVLAEDFGNLDNPGDVVELLTLRDETGEVLLDDPLLESLVLDEIFIEVFVLLGDTLREVLLVILLDEDTPTVLLEGGLIVEVLLDEGLTTCLLLDLVERVDEVFEADFFEEGNDLELDCLVEVEIDLVLDLLVDVVGRCKTHLQACLTAGTFKLGMGESCLSLRWTISMVAPDSSNHDSQRGEERTE